VVDTVLGVLRRFSKVGRVEVGEDVSSRAGSVGGELVLLNITAEVAESGRGDSLASSGLVWAGCHLLDLDVRVLEGSVRETETELVDGSDVVLVKGTVVNEAPSSKLSWGLPWPLLGS